MSRRFNANSQRNSRESPAATAIRTSQAPRGSDMPQRVSVVAGAIDAVALPRPPARAPDTSGESPQQATDRRRTIVESFASRRVGRSLRIPPLLQAWSSDQAADDPPGVDGSRRTLVSLSSFTSSNCSTPTARLQGGKRSRSRPLHQRIHKAASVRKAQADR